MRKRGSKLPNDNLSGGNRFFEHTGESGNADMRQFLGRFGRLNVRALAISSIKLSQAKGFVVNAVGRSNWL